MMMTQSGTTPPPQPSLMQKLLRMLSLTRERELTCDEVYELMDYYTELKRNGENVEGLMPQMAHHLHICPECREEYEALLAVLAVPETPAGS